MIPLGPEEARSTTTRRPRGARKARPKARAPRPLGVAFLDAAGTVLASLELPQGGFPPLPGERQLLIRRAVGLAACSVVLVRRGLEPPFQLRLGELAVFAELAETLHRRGVLFVSLLLLSRDGSFLHLHLDEDALLWAPGYAGQLEMATAVSEPS